MSRTPFQASPALYVEGLTGLRGCAALWVLLQHAWGLSIPKRIETNLWGLTLDFTPFFSMGGVGVDIFFVLSGFLLTLPYAKAALGLQAWPSLKIYLARRLLRVAPAYYFQMLVLAVLAALGVYGTLVSPFNYLLHLTFLHNLEYEFYYSINMIYWTLPIELNFYLVLPFLALLLIGKRWILLLAASFATAWVYKLSAFPFVANDTFAAKVWVLEQLPGRMDQFGTGMLAAYLLVRWNYKPTSRSTNKLSSASLSHILLVAGILGMTGMCYVLDSVFNQYWNGGWPLFIWRTIFGIFIAMLILGITLNGSASRLLFANKPMIFCGVISYSIYLWHFIVLQWLNSTHYFSSFSGYKMPALLALSLPLVVLISSCSYWFVERPFLKLSHQPFSHRLSSQ